uniref:Cercosporin MFS transporter CTB4 (Cercosporin toxin biosynthesis cluster protein 4) n=1 Tax=Ganoderma boninense TaxID=34458 RepID=A0A5K1JT00_9APHY|nr:Cercosporin MFS transporter CTB4 (Cercosporin toxin biosynthesis cluster protein 4) [Ganoderma boninense]
MAFGILEDNTLDNIPGTSLLSAKVTQASTEGAGDLKRGTGKHSHIVLIPQPSDDPRDPLNWPRWKKETCFWMLRVHSTLLMPLSPPHSPSLAAICSVFASTLEGALYPLASAGYGVLAKEFNVSVDEIASSFSACFLGLGISALAQNALAFKYGRRPAFLLSSFVMFASCVWTALSKDLVSIRAACIFLGFGMVAPEAFVPTTIEHIFFVHERGSRTLIWNFATRASITLGECRGPFIYGYVIQNLSWQLGFWFAGFACGVCFLGVFFFVPETTYHRHLGTRLRDVGDKDSIKKIPSMRENRDTEAQDVDRHASLPKPPSFLSHLKIYNGTFSDESLWRIFVRPFPFLLSPVTWFMFLSYSLPTVWFAITNLCSSTIFTITYHFNPAQIGLTHLSGLVGTIVGALITGPFNDWAIIRISQRNRGIYEPEFRLIFMLAMLFGVFGYAAWAVGIDHHMPWIGSVACIAALNVSLAVSGGSAMAYLLDTHGPNAVHVVSLVNTGRDLVLYGTTLFANGFIASRGVKTSLVVLASCQALSALAAVAMYVYGKRVRSFVSPASPICLQAEVRGTSGAERTWQVARHPHLFYGDLLASCCPQSATAAAETDSTLGAFKTRCVPSPSRMT